MEIGLNEEELIVPLLCEPGQQAREAAKRKRSNLQITVAEGDVEARVADGWIFQKKVKGHKARLQKPLSIDAQLENRVWLLFYLMGYREIGGGRDFRIRFTRKNEQGGEKQVDVFAKDDETVIIVECKACEKPKKRSLQKDIEEFANLKGHIARAIKEHYGAKFKPKILWMFATQNVQWSTQDAARAKGENIHIITERELRYYLQIAEHLRAAARYQFLAEFLRGQKIPELANYKVPAIRGKLGPHKFYGFITNAEELLKISFVNHRSLDDPEGAPTYQRLVSRTRMRQISAFLKGGGFFPTNLLINFSRPVRFEQMSRDDTGELTFGHLYLPDRYKSAWIVDGQHRLYGFAHLPPDKRKQNLLVLAFEQLPKETEADLFVTINHEQKSVPKTLLDDLEGELKWESEIPAERLGAIAARLIGVLNSDIGEPLYRRFAQQGIPSTDRASLTIPAIKDGLRRSGLIGVVGLKRKEFRPGPLSGLNDSETLDRSRAALNLYFSLVKVGNETLWDAGRLGFVCTNTGVHAHLRLFSALIRYMESNSKNDPRQLNPQELLSEIEEYVEPVLKLLREADPSKAEKEFKVEFGSGGFNEYYFRLCAIVQKQFTDFLPEGFETWNEEQSDERIDQADRRLKRINVIVQKVIFDTFKKHYGLERDAYFNKGVIDKAIKTKAYEKSQDDSDEARLPLENYLDFIQYKKIAENKAHWPWFAPIFDIPEPGEKGYSKNIQWMERINELRRISAHATESRRYSVDDFAYIDFVFKSLWDKAVANGFDLELEYD
jgi:DNA sulfur modification protein DndB